MTYDFSTWYLSVVPVILAVLLGVAGNAGLKGTMRQLGGRIQTHQDLAAARLAINANKRLAWAYLALWLGQMIAVAFAVKAGLTTFLGAVGHLFAFGVLTLPAGLWAKSVENTFKAMAVDRSDPALAQTFQRYLADWKKPSLTIPE